MKLYYEDKPNKFDMQLVMDDLNDNHKTVCLYIDIWHYKAKVKIYGVYYGVHFTKM